MENDPTQLLDEIESMIVGFAQQPYDQVIETFGNLKAVLGGPMSTNITIHERVHSALMKTPCRFSAPWWEFWLSNAPTNSYSTDGWLKCLMQAASCVPWSLQVGTVVATWVQNNRLDPNTSAAKTALGLLRRFIICVGFSQKSTPLWSAFVLLLTEQGKFAEALCAIASTLHLPLEQRRTFGAKISPGSILFNHNPVYCQQLNIILKEPWDNLPTSVDLGLTWTQIVAQLRLHNTEPTAAKSTVREIRRMLMQMFSTDRFRLSQILRDNPADNFEASMHCACQPHVLLLVQLLSITVMYPNTWQVMALGIELLANSLKMIRVQLRRCQALAAWIEPIGALACDFRVLAAQQLLYKQSKFWQSWHSLACITAEGYGPGVESFETSNNGEFGMVTFEAATLKAIDVYNSALSNQAFGQTPYVQLVQGWCTLQLIANPSRATQEAARQKYADSICQWKRLQQEQRATTIDDQAIKENLLGLYSNACAFEEQFNFPRKQKQIFELAVACPTINQEESLWLSFVRFSLTRGREGNTKNVLQQAVTTVPEQNAQELWKLFLAQERKYVRPQMTLEELKAEVAAWAQKNNRAIPFALDPRSELQPPSVSHTRSPSGNDASPRSNGSARFSPTHSPARATPTNEAQEVENLPTRKRQADEKAVMPESKRKLTLGDILTDEQFVQFENLLEADIICSYNKTATNFPHA